MKHRETRRRTAFTLIELSVSMSAGSALMILAIGWVHQSMSLASVGRQRSDQQRTFSRLAGEFRRDVHRAAKCTAPSPQSIQLLLPGDETVTYQAHGNRVTRQQPLADGRWRRDAFELGADSTAMFASIDQQTRVVLTVVQHEQGANQEPPVDRKIAAVVGRLARHEKGEVSP